MEKALQFLKLIFPSVLSGLFIGFCFPHVSISFFVFIALVPFLIQAKYIKKWKTLFFLSWNAGFVSMLTGFYWIQHTMVIYGHLPAWLSFIFFIIFAVVIGFYFPFIVFFPMFIARKTQIKSNWFLLAAGMSFFEFLFPKMFLWTFGNLGYGNILFVQAADIFGSFGLSFFVFLINMVIAHLAISYREKTKFMTKEAVISIVVIVLLHIYGAVRYYQIDSLIETPDKKLTIGAIQPNFSLEYLASNKHLTEKDQFDNLSKLFEMSTKIKQDNPAVELVVWPESTVGYWYDYDLDFQKLMKDFVEKNNTDLIFTTFYKDPVEKNSDALYSTAYLLGKNTKVQGIYKKMFLIPFGETTPFADTFPWFKEFLEGFIDNLSQFKPGKDFTVLPTTTGTNIAATICMDALEPNIAKGLINNGGEVIVTEANFAWFGAGGASRSVLELLRFRALENRVPTVLIANSGESLFIDSLGRNSTKVSKLFTEDSISHTVSINKITSIYSLIGNLSVYIMGALYFIFLIIYHSRKKRKD